MENVGFKPGQSWPLESQRKLPSDRGAAHLCRRRCHRLPSSLASTSMEQGWAPRHGLKPINVTAGTLPTGHLCDPGNLDGRQDRSPALTADGDSPRGGVAQYREIAYRGSSLDSRCWKPLIHEQTWQILGVHAIGTGATELIFTSARP